jgi:hypothetical protein
MRDETKDKKDEQEVEIEDLKPEKDPKGGIIGVLGPQVNRPKPGTTPEPD